MGINKTLGAVAWLSLIITACLVFGLQLPFSRLEVPYVFAGDAVQKLTDIQTVAENGWLFYNHRLGFPLGYDRLDFPRYDSLNYAIMGPIAALTGHPGFAMNFYFIASFYLIAFSAFYVFRRLGLNFYVATIAAVAYAILPYHIYRGVLHLTNGAYYLVPLAIFVALLLAQGKINWITKEGRRLWCLALLVGILVPLQMPYNGVFFAFLCCVAVCMRLAQGWAWREIVLPLSVIAAIGGTFLVEQIPARMHAAEHGAITVGRSPKEAEIYSMRLTQVLMPSANHRVSELRELSNAFNDATLVPRNESRFQYVGIIGVVGFAALLWSLLRALSRRRNEDASALEHSVRAAAILSLAILLLAISSGFGNVVAYFISDNIRAYNRIHPFFAFCCLLGGGWAIQALLSKLRQPVRDVATILLGIALIIEILPIGAPSSVRAQTVAEYDATQAYFRELEEKLGPKAKVFQLPVIWFPEHPPVNRMYDYDNLKPFLLTDTLIFSPGGGRYREGYRWANEVAKAPAAQRVAEIRSKGFDAILIDSFAYKPDGMSKLVKDLSAVIPGSPIVSSDQRWWTFLIRDVSLKGSAAPAAIDYAIGGPPLRFSADDDISLRGWHEPEPWGRWGLSSAALDLHLTPPPTGPLRMTVDARVMVGPLLPTRRLSVQCNGQPCGDFTFTEATIDQSLAISLPAGLVKEGRLSVRFVVTPEATPASAGVNSDARSIGVGLRQLTIVPE